ncbi:hypothetical protein ASPBRDRAFT_78057 [Aspergillus brasiliensis CBS 101740]|uniref:Major facilitator superfamily (MFS) profile domain-containing protein n=1 Tax=Aspergillus brasiliensis (strain CBS 101740 / IMI 381727 / IBT 21946) TaxID=767769 RepID=A0A1L9U7Z2_ASPBC|nr:hypothetical protein ASPBRDRAFT_78057 [Aspergillus brasiliensis CBS 101740]
MLSEAKSNLLEEFTEATLSPEHQEYLIKRHGRLDLDPIPAFGDADPYNWPIWEKVTNLILVGFHAMMATFIAAAIIPAYTVMAADLGKPVEDISYLTSLQIAILGGAPLFWRPLSSRWGRRPIFVLSLICTLVCNIGCARSPNYGSMAACRALAAFFISPPLGIDSAAVAETFFGHERARYMGIWTLHITLGARVPGLMMGFVEQPLPYRWIYWILAIMIQINGVQLILFIFLGRETRYIYRNGDYHEPNFKQRCFSFSRIDPTPLRLYDLVHPLSMVKHAYILVPIVIEVPALFAPKFGSDAQQLGLQFIAMLIGTIIGQQLGGPLSDFWMRRRAKKSNQAQFEYRLCLAYPGYLFTIVGVIVLLVRIEEAPQGHWNVTPDVGMATMGSRRRSSHLTITQSHPQHRLLH